MTAVRGGSRGGRVPRGPGRVPGLCRGPSLSAGPGRDSGKIQPPACHRNPHTNRDWGQRLGVQWSDAGSLEDAADVQSWGPEKAERLG